MQIGKTKILAGVPAKRLRDTLIKMDNANCLRRMTFRRNWGLKRASCATLLADLLVLHASAHKALKAQQRGTLRTKSVHAERMITLRKPRRSARRPMNGAKSATATVGAVMVRPASNVDAPKVRVSSGSSGWVE